MHNADIVALLDDGSLHRWRRVEPNESKWMQISSINIAAGSEAFRVRFRSASTQLTYNDAIAVSESHIYFGGGRMLKQVVSL
jgi:hypothetical protein